MAIDADGSPQPYNPSDTGLDNLANASRPGNWWGARDRQRKADRSPSHKVQQRSGSRILPLVASLVDPAFTRVQQRRYVNSEVIPFFVLPSAVLTATGIRLGDFALVQNGRTDKQSFAIFADGAPEESSARALLLLRSPLACHPALSMAGPVSLTLRFLHFLAAERTRPYRRPMFKPRTQPRLPALAEPPDSSSGSQLSPGRSAQQTEPIYVR